MKIKLGLAALILGTLSSTAHAGYLISNATISTVYNVSSNSNSFALAIAGGTGVCAGTLIVFPVTSAPDADTHKRAYAAALLAFAMGKTVTIYNYANDSCSGASYIQVNG